ncbi:hypothetical protein GC093_13430 [Paenibacillus sp. LMG 31456]|uniref:Uncharacterized protein n=1 Tax=Paenibacillus foliorum TaxID=2654974 RepID=A0A972GNX1_9BACL|nr:hypothetical protein [Paenibacillus foliorum]NOU94211.1 hypothetical protein [Paenibacillus foliorum]
MRNLIVGILIGGGLMLAFNASAAIEPLTGKVVESMSVVELEGEVIGLSITVDGTNYVPTLKLTEPLGLKVAFDDKKISISKKIKGEPYFFTEEEIQDKVKTMDQQMEFAKGFVESYKRIRATKALESVKEIDPEKKKKNDLDELSYITSEEFYQMIASEHEKLKNYLLENKRVNVDAFNWMAVDSGLMISKKTLEYYKEHKYPAETLKKVEEDIARLELKQAELLHPPSTADMIAKIKSQTKEDLKEAIKNEELLISLYEEALVSNPNQSESLFSEINTEINKAKMQLEKLKIRFDELDTVVQFESESTAS